MQGVLSEEPSVESGESNTRIRRSALERARTRRKRWLLVLLTLPALASLLTDVLRRGDRLAQLEPGYLGDYALAFIESWILWGVLLYAAARRRGRLRWPLAILFALLFAASYGGQQYFFEQYNAYLNVDVMLFATDVMDSVINQWLADLPRYLEVELPPFLAAVAAVWAVRKLARPRRSRARIAQVLAPTLIVAALFIPTQYRHLQASTPDVLYLHAMGGLVRTQVGLSEQSHQIRPKQRHSKPVAPLESTRGTPPNIVFLILESVRSDAVCIEPSDDCEVTPFTNELAPQRFPLTEMRSLDSCTAISLAVLWSGVGPNESREVLHTWPLLFDYAKAAGYDTVFWTSQNMLFGNARLWVKNLGVRDFVSATDLEPTADLDMGAHEGLLADYVEQHTAGLKEPFLAVIQLSNVHYPYLVDPSLPQPFQPASMNKGPEQNASFFNEYKNAVHQQDMHAARILRAFRNLPSSERTIMVYTSDHGEAFREHNQLGHTFSVLDEEVHVPAWIDVPEGVLSDAEREALANKAHAYVFHPDLPVTILDAMGLWDAKALDPYRGKMLGHSLLRPGVNERALPMTNCAQVWSCAFENWGYIKQHMKLEARAWDPDWHCYDLRLDPEETKPLASDHCAELQERALRTFGRLPGSNKN